MRCLMLLIVTVFGASHASASSIMLVPLQSNQVVVGQTVSFDVLFDFTDELGLVPVGGGFDIAFDADALAFEGLVTDFVGDPQFFRVPDVLDGLLESWGLGTFSGWPATGRFGTVSFTVLSTMGPTATLFGQPTSGVSGPWVCAADITCFFFPDYNTVELTRVPLPPAAALFVGALAAIAGLRRSR